MDDSRRELILQTAKAALEKPGKPPELAIHRHRTRPIERDQLPAAVIFNGIEEITRQSAAPPIVNRELTFRVEIRGEGEPSDQVLDAYLSWAEQQLTTDPDFLALIRWVEVRKVIWNQAPAKQPRAAAAVEFVLEYRTKFGDPTSPAP